VFVSGEIMQFHQRSLGPPELQNELVVIGMAHIMLGWRAKMNLVSIMSQNHVVKVYDGRDTRNCRLRCRGKWKTLRNLPSGHGIKLGSFHGYKTIGLTIGNLNWKK
jgi:hypothetical protein